MPRINEIVWAGSFKRAFRTRVLGQPPEQVFRERLAIFIENPFDARLKTHKLSGSFEGLWAFTVAYDCRVVFRFLSQDRVLLIDIGKHDEVY